MSEGTFNGTGNNKLTITNKQITIIGSGIDKTIIDLDGSQFLKINSGTISLANLTIINGFSSYGGAIYSNGNLNVDSVKFVNNTATSGGGAIFVTYTPYFLHNNVFINCSSTNNQGNEICVGSNSNRYGYITFQDMNITSNTFIINAKITDDMGTPIHGGEYSIKIDDTVVATNVKSVNGNIQATVSKILENGEHVLSMDSDDLIVTSGIAYVNITRTFTNYYVSPWGDDTNDGSKNNPFKTIKQAISKGFEENEYVNVYLLEGNYNGTGNTNVDISSLKSVGIVNIYGIYNKTIIDGLDSTIGFKLGSIDVNFYNVTITRLKSTAATGVIVGTGTINFVDCIFEKNNVAILLTAENANLKNVKISNNQLNANPKNMIQANRVNIAVKNMDNVTFEKNRGVGVITVKSQLLNSKFLNNDYFSTIVNSREQQGLIRVVSGATLMSNNNLFENNTWRAFFIQSGTLISQNDVFINNSATKGAAISGTKSILINDTFKYNVATVQGAAISGGCELYNCTFVDNKVNDEREDIYATDINIDNNLTFVDINSTTFMPELKAVFESGDLVVSGTKVYFYLDDENVANATLNRNVAVVSVITSGGIHKISGFVNDKSNVTTGILNVSLADASDVELYVSEFGSDIDGNGSFSNPFATIKKAYDYGMQQNTYNMYIKTIGTLNGTGNVLLNLKPFMNLTIMGVDKETSIIDVESNKYLFNVEPYDKNLKIRFENLTIKNGASPIQVKGKYLTVENCLFNNITEYALSLNGVYDSEVIINNSQFINSSGAYSSSYAKNNYITNSIFINNSIDKNVISIKNGRQEDDYDCQVFMKNLTFDGTYSDDASLEWNSASNILLSGVNSTILDCVIKNSVNCSAIFVTPSIAGNYKNHNVFVSLVNSRLENNYFDFSASYSYQSDPRPTIELINTTVIKGGGVYYPDLRYQNIWWNVVNSSFINMTKEMLFKGSDIKPNNTIYRPVVNITNTLFLNNPNGIKIVQGNISECVFYDSPLYIADANLDGSQPPAVVVYLNNNYWNNLIPNYEIITDKYTVYCDEWLVPALISDNKPGYTQTIELAYMQYDGKNYSGYDTSKMPIFDEEYTMSVTDGSITPTSGVLTNNDTLLFSCVANSLGNKTITSKLSNGLIVELNATFYKVKTLLNLTLDSDDVHVGDNLTVNVMVTDQDANLLNGSVDIYLNGVLADTINLIAGEGKLSIVMDKKPMVYEVFANYTGDDYYQSSVNSTNFNLLKTEMNVDVKNKNSHDNVTFDIDFNYPANGVVDITVNKKTYSTPVKEGKAQIVLPPMDVGDYEAAVSYNGIVNKTVPFTVARDTKTTIKAEDVQKHHKEDIILEVSLIDAYDKALANEKITVSVGGKTYTANTNNNGVASFKLDLGPGNYIANINYQGNSKQDQVNTTAKVTVLSDTATIITVDDLVMDYKEGSALNVTLTDVYGKALANEKITLSVGGKTFIDTTNDKGVASFKLDLEPSNYTAVVKYAGSDKQDAANTTANIIVNKLSTIITADDLVMYYKDGTVFEVTLANVYGEALANQKVTISIAGKSYTETTDEDGITTFSLNLEVGNYTAIVKYGGNDIQYAANTTADITVLYNYTSVISINDIVVYNEKGSVLNVALTDAYDNALANEKVTVSVDGKNYTATTNDKGVASFTLDVKLGDYLATVTYPGNAKQNPATKTETIKVLTETASIITADDLVMYYKDGSILNVTLTNVYREALANQKITLSINGKTYTATTNDKGVASFKLDLEVGNYTAVVKYGGDDKQDPANTTVNIKVLDKITTVISADDLVMYYNDGTTLDITLTDIEGNALANENVILTINGVNKTGTTNKKGIASFNIDLEPGNYAATISYSGNSKYNPSNADVNVAVNKIPTVIVADDLVMYYNDGTTLDITLTDIEGNALANENVILTINGVNKTGTTNKKGIASFNIDLEPGNYAATISYSGNSKYNPSNADVNVAVKKIPTVIVADDLVMTYGDEDSLNITLTDIEGNALANEEIAVSIGGKTYKVKTNNQGVTSIPITLKVGNYTASISYSGNKEFDSSKASANIKVLVNTRTIIVADDLVMYYKNGSRFVVKLTDAFDTPLVNESIIISLNGANYTRTINDKGIASIAINLNSGNYSVNVYYNGSKAHDAISASANINVLPTVFGKDIVKMFRNGTQYYATFLDGQGNPLADNTLVKFNINGVMYERKTNKGVAKLNINLEQGTYIITAINPVNGEMASNNITVLPKLVGANLVKYYKNASQYWVQVFGDDGNPVGEGKTVTFNINGVMYERKTDASGWAKLNINLSPGNYIVTAMYGGCNIANNIAVLSILEAKDLSMSYKDGSQFKATLLDGQGKPFAGKSVTFNINGVFYNRVTNSNGVAALNINLMPGEYIITSSYNGCNVANTIKIKS